MHSHEDVACRSAAGLYILQCLPYTFGPSSLLGAAGLFCSGLLFGILCLAVLGVCLVCLFIWALTFCHSWNQVLKSTHTTEHQFEQWGSSVPASHPASSALPSWGCACLIVRGFICYQAQHQVLRSTHTTGTRC